MLRFKCCFVIIDTAKVLWQLCHIVAEDFKNIEILFFMLSVKKQEIPIVFPLESFIAMYITYL